MTGWVRLWHDMPTDPKWRTIARKSGQPLPCVIALFSLLMVNASDNADDRGTLRNWDNEDAATALDMEPEDVSAIMDAMQGKVLEGARLTGWEKRQPKREDATAAKRKAEWKERKGTQRNATERIGTADTDTDTDSDTSYAPSAPEVADKAAQKKDYAFKGNIIRLLAKDLDLWAQTYHAIPDLRAELTSLDAWISGQPKEKQGRWFHIVGGCLNKKHQEAMASRASNATASADPMVDLVLSQKRRRDAASREGHRT